MSRGRYTRRVKKIRDLFWTAVGCFAVHALSYLFMPVSLAASENGGSRKALLLVGCVFWISLLLGYLLLIPANSERKAYIRKQLDGDVSMRCRMGIAAFFSNTPAFAADAALLAGILALAIIYFCGATNRYITYIALAIVSFSLNMHGMFNGRIYKITKYKRMRRVENHE